MGENAKKIGAKLEGFGEYLFSHIGWSELARDLEIKCERKNIHEKQTHGLDLVMDFENPYLKKRQGVIIECKNRQMKSITSEEIQKWINELIYSIECAGSAKELAHIGLNSCSLNTGLLLIHANDGMFNKEKFYNYLMKCFVKSRRRAINIFVAGNDMINQWTSLIEKLGRDYNQENHFAYVCPSIDGSNMAKNQFLTIDQLFSKYILAENIVANSITSGGTPWALPKKQKIMLSFDTISKESFEYMWSMYKTFQFQDADEFVFLFYPRKKDDKEFVNSYFIDTLKKNNISIDKEMEKKIVVDFIDNRELSPVDTKG